MLLRVLMIVWLLPTVIILWRALDVYRYGQDSCRWLVQTGYMADDLKWKPHRCRMHWYDTNDAHQCFISRSHSLKSASDGQQTGESSWSYIELVGDSRIVGIWNALLELCGKVHHRTRQKVRSKVPLVTRDVDKKLKIELIWSHYTTYIKLRAREDELQPTLVIVGGSVLWSLMLMDHRKEPALDIFRRKVRNFVDKARRNSRDFGTQYVWRLDYDFPEITVANSRNKTRYRFFSNRALKLYNQEAIKVLKEYPADEILIWSNTESYLRSLSLRGFKPFQDAFHPKSYEFESQVVLNIFCNRYLASPAGNETGLCCDGIDPPGILVSVFGPSASFLFKVPLVITVFFIVWRKSGRRGL